MGIVSSRNCEMSTKKDENVTIRLTLPNRFDEFEAVRVKIFTEQLEDFLGDETIQVKMELNELENEFPFLSEVRNIEKIFRQKDKFLQTEKSDNSENATQFSFFISNSTLFDLREADDVILPVRLLTFITRRGCIQSVIKQSVTFVISGANPTAPILILFNKSDDIEYTEPTPSLLVRTHKVTLSDNANSTSFLMFSAVDSDNSQEDSLENMTVNCSCEWRSSWLSWTVHNGTLTFSFDHDQRRHRDSSIFVTVTVIDNCNQLRRGKNCRKINLESFFFVLPRKTDLFLKGYHFAYL